MSGDRIVPRSSMEAPPREPAAGAADQFLFLSGHAAHIEWMRAALAHHGQLGAAPPATPALAERIAQMAPRAVLLDFSGDQAGQARQLREHLRQHWPELPLVAAGTAAEPASMLAALRAGVDDFIDMDASVDEARRIIDTLVERRRAERSPQRGATVALLGARAGLGVTTLATNLAVALQDILVREIELGTGGAERAAATRQGVALLDLGLPARDGLLYLDTDSGFSFVDGVRNLRRIDPTLIETALAHHASGTAILPLPASLSQVRDISHADSVALMKRLSEFFDYQIVDLGGFGTLDFVAQSVREADRAWIVCDQSLGAIVSTANLLRELQGRGLGPERFTLVVNRFDAAVGLSGRDIAERLGLTLGPVLPARSTMLLSTASRGELPVRAARGDPWVQSVLAMARGLRTPADGRGDAVAAREMRWSALMAQLTGRRSKSSSKGT